MTMLERDVERPVCRWASKEMGIKVLKLSAPNQRGQGDRLFLKNRIAAFIEFKRPGKKPTALQWKFLKWARSEGFPAEWFDNREKAKVWLTKVFGLEDFEI